MWIRLVPSPAGSIVKIRLTKEMRSFEGTGREVVYSLVGMGMGVKFTDADPEQLWTMEKWVESSVGNCCRSQSYHSHPISLATKEKRATKNMVF